MIAPEKFKAPKFDAAPRFELLEIVESSLAPGLRFAIFLDPDDGRLRVEFAPVYFDHNINAFVKKHWFSVQQLMVMNRMVDKVLDALDRWERDTHVRSTKKKASKRKKKKLELERGY